MREGLFGVALDEGLDQSSFTHSRRAHHRHDDRRWLFGQPIDERDMESLFFDLENDMIFLEFVFFFLPFRCCSHLPLLAL